ncbi:MAG: succinate dehydrogenase assembly factor 2 [Rickettsiales bacterium]|nr:succinate dehydrogenase assembly factor 2 [Rickettsiales bacterium]
MNKVLSTNTMSGDSRLKRLIFRSVHRGCKETDLIFAHFAEHTLPGLQGAQLDAYERLLDEDDADIWQWLIGKADPGEDYASLIDILKTYGVPRDNT